MKKLILLKLVVNYAMDLTTLKIAHQRKKERHLKKHTTANLANHFKHQEGIGQLLQDTIKGTPKIRHIKKGDKLWMKP
jgi:hypothetical protein